MEKGNKKDRRSKVRKNTSPRMTTITPQHDPLSPIHPTHRTQIPRHVSRGLDNPKRAISEEVHGLIERAERYPWPGELCTSLGGVLGVEEAAVPLGVGEGEVAGGTGGEGGGTEEGGREGEGGGGVAVVPVGVAGGKLVGVWEGGGRKYLNIMVLMSRGEIPRERSCSGILRRGAEGLMEDSMYLFTQGV